MALMSLFATSGVALECADGKTSIVDSVSKWNGKSYQTCPAKSYFCFDGFI